MAEWLSMAKGEVVDESLCDVSLQERLVSLEGLTQPLTADAL
jgi:hypothetical protein